MGETSFVGRAMAQPLLVTLLPSTDVDLGRWLLSHYGVAYRERPHAPIFHVLALKSWSVSAEGYPLLVSADRIRLRPLRFWRELLRDVLINC